MEDYQMNKVFSSNITRSDSLINHDLYDLLDITPATPIDAPNDKSGTTLCPFRPNIDKFYIPKKRSRLKVKTVRDIRNTFENDVYTYLPEELEKQRNMLLKKIKDGSATNEQFKNITRDILNAENPISRTTWQMLINLNPDSHKYSKQYVLWNGQYIHVNGSKGGRIKFICKYDLGNIDKMRYKKNIFKKKNKKIGLLKNSLFVKFKPGPLSTKKYLDDSHQKYNVGEIELIHLPKPCLDIQPTYGISLDVNLTHFLNSWRGVSGDISQKWAEFATSVVGTKIKSNVMQKDPHSKITFESNYKFDQNRILMRRDADKPYKKSNINLSDIEICVPTEDIILSEVKHIVNEMLDSVELSLVQDTLFNEVYECKENICEHSDITNLTKREKPKKKYTELDRLDVTVIQLPDKCQNSFCKLGCVCESLQYTHNSKRHCGLIKCMFSCKCNFSKYNKDIENVGNESSEMLPALVNLNKERQLKLAKEEQKFHQTVIVSGEKRILLKGDKRHSSLKTSKNCCDNVTNSQNILIDKELSVVTRKLNFRNVEPWCMTHNLYKCFCKNRFIEKYNYEANVLNMNNSIDESLNVIETKEQCNNACPDNTSKIETRQEKRKSVENIINPVINIDDYNCSCARVKPFCRRKHNKAYYEITNSRILEMEKNDLKLQDKLINKVNKIKSSKRKSKRVANLTLASQPTKDQLPVRSEPVHINKPQLQSHVQSEPTNENKPQTQPGLKTKPINIYKPQLQPHVQSEPINVYKPLTQPTIIPLADSTLIPWIESSYKLYKQQVQLGIAERTLEPPKLGKFAFYSWNFILDRYKEKKNLFLVSKTIPCRIFMAVNQRHPAFVNCINIDHIHTYDLYKFPETVKRLLTSSQELEDNFCILRGLSFCWEFVGSVAKKAEVSIDLSDNPDVFNYSESSKSKLIDSVANSSDADSNISVTEERSSTSLDIDSTSIDSFNEEIQNNMQGSSRWFVMRIENDFSEIHFKEKGFFVKYDSILSAIHVARQSNKTVRISSQKRTDKSIGSQFGIYAIPNANEFCVFVGPYETDEPLGIETVKTFLDMGKHKSTRGVWITTNKMDNANVIDSPMLFMPSADKSFEEMITICNYSEETAERTEVINKTDVEITEKSAETNKKDNHQNLEIESPSVTPKAIKVVKPIKIRKVDAVYRISSSSILNTLGTKNVSDKNNSNRIQLINKCPSGPHSRNILDATFNKSNIRPLKVISGKSSLTRPVAQIAPQVNKDLQQSLRERDKTNMGVKSGLIILKPEEVVKLLTEKKFEKAGTSKEKENENEKSNSFEDVLVISDDEEREDAEINYKPTSDAIEWRDVKITCSTVNWAAWLPGRKNNQNLLSYTFPGCAPSIFCEEAEALSEINSDLSNVILFKWKLNFRQVRNTERHRWQRQTRRWGEEVTGRSGVREGVRCGSGGGRRNL
ncbi:hypothetical protein K1T71_005072 [Dendrolimus kikuchii]|uniref:Uncharacterized protein n=1 Tax=Dendrolimus kikuchii TaxID=765133 RepID=A0ACC1D6C5_9NEOP|nr:hypothetical protein K1T71_005072 [Dendrolimus kikuchii]